MTAVGGALIEAVGGALVTAAVLDAVDAARRRGVARRPPWLMHALRAAATRLAVRYDASRAGRRLAARLDAASVRRSPARWRAEQIAVLLPAALVLNGVVGSSLWALSIASLMVRGGAWAFLRSRRERRDDELVAAAVVLARCLATELVGGSTPAEAWAALSATEEARCRLRLRDLLAAASSRARLGEPVISALHRSIYDLPEGRGRDTLALLATELELVIDRGSGTAVLTRFAAAVEERSQTVAEVRAAAGEIRMTTLAIPAMTSLIAIMLVVGDPAVAAAALGPVGAPVAAALGAIAASATAVARRVTSPWERGS
jgi:Flp pilus assembly protein TadB